MRKVFVFASGNLSDGFDLTLLLGSDFCLTYFKTEDRVCSYLHQLGRLNLVSRRLLLELWDFTLLCIFHRWNPLPHLEYSHQQRHLEYPEKWGIKFQKQWNTVSKFSTVSKNQISFTFFSNWRKLKCPRTMKDKFKEILLLQKLLIWMWKQGEDCELKFFGVLFIL